MHLGQPPMHVSYVGPKASSDTCNSVAFISLDIGHNASNVATSKVPFKIPVMGLRDVAVDEVL